MSQRIADLVLIRHLHHCSVPAKKKAGENVTQKILEGDMEGAEKESVIYLEHRTQRINELQETTS